MKKRRKRRAVFMDEELHEKIKNAAKSNNRKILDEIRSRFINIIKP